MGTAIALPKPESDIRTESERFNFALNLERKSNFDVRYIGCHPAHGNKEI